MAYLYEKSATWRRLVAFTKKGPLYMALFAGVCVGAPMMLGNSVMNKTNPDHETDLERQLRARSSMHDKASGSMEKNPWCAGFAGE
jgi:hypothetical protein